MQDDDAPMTKPRVRAKFDEARPPPPLGRLPPSPRIPTNNVRR
jgi:hypothetical protein